MRLFGRTQCIFIVLSILSACTYGLSVDLNRLRELRRPFILDKRPDATCTGNPCPAWQPFLCQSSGVCIALDSVCDGHPDCPDHFDEDEELCNARKRPPVETIYKFLKRNRKWMLQKLFSGADLELVAHSLAGNPCPAWQPFLCQSSGVCIALDSVCDGHPDCPDHFDEDEELCNARKRPPVETIYKFLKRNRKWMLQKLFSGADLELVAHSLAVATSLQDISMMVGLTPKAERNLENVFIGVLQNDMRPLLKLGMPKGEWYDTSSLLTQIVDGGLNV